MRGSHSLAVEDAEGARRHAVDAPVGVAVVVAQRYREAAVVGPDQIDVLALRTVDGQHGTLALVGHVVTHPF